MSPDIVPVSNTDLAVTISLLLALLIILELS
jgi:hypothetical protein